MSHLKLVFDLETIERIFREIENKELELKYSCTCYELSKQDYEKADYTYCPTCGIVVEKTTIVPSTICGYYIIQEDSSFNDDGDEEDSLNFNVVLSSCYDRTPGAISFEDMLKFINIFAPYASALVLGLEHDY